jgi:hypothetical protein
MPFRYPRLNLAEDSGTTDSGIFGCHLNNNGLNCLLESFYSPSKMNISDSLAAYKYFMVESLFQLIVTFYIVHTNLRNIMGCFML